VTWRSLLAFFSAPGDAKSDGMVPFGRGDAKFDVVSFGLDAPGRADMAAGPCTLAPSPTTLVPPSRRQPPVAPPIAIAATREREREREREIAATSARRWRLVQGAPLDLADLAGFLLLH
jgi:hypothetical protein